MLLDFIISSLKPQEVGAFVRLKLEGWQQRHYQQSLNELAGQLNDLDYCYAALHKVSRSFAVVIQNLPTELRDAVCVYYLLLRGLDSIEDDMQLPLSQKLNLLKNFHILCTQSGWNLSDTGDKQDYRDLLAHFEKVIAVYLRLNVSYREVIQLSVQQMGHGMAEFAEKKVQSSADYDLYCHYVAGLVGIGLSGLFSASRYEAVSLTQQKIMANSMGLFLQKTNIIRDYLEDLEGGRSFWPMQIWSKYADDLKEFAHHPTSQSATFCLNELITDALQHVPDCITYLNLIQHPQVFRFCAVPQAMAMATLQKLYNNPDVFRKTVKIRKGLAARLMVETRDMTQFTKFLEKFIYRLMHRLAPQDPNYLLMKKRLHRIIEAVDATRVPPHISSSDYGRTEQKILF